MPDGSFSSTSSVVEVTQYDEKKSYLEGTIIVLMKPRRFRSHSITPEPDSDKLKVRFKFSEVIFF